MLNDLSFEQFVESIHMLGNREEISTLVDNYIGVRAGSFPVVEGNTAHFVYRLSDDERRSEDITIGVNGEWTGGSPKRAMMTPIGGGLLHYQHDFEPDARLDYRFARLTSDSVHTFLDPLNAHVGKAGFGDNSELAMPSYVRPPVTLEQASVAPGQLVQGIVMSKALRQQRGYIVYLPQGYSEQESSYPTLYFHDGGDYLNMGEAKTILDNLIASKTLSPVVAVFVPPVEREREYNCSDVFTSFFCDELVPEMQRLYHLDARPERRCVIGPSLGGLISLYMASQRPDTFRIVYAQSPAISTTIVNGTDKFDARTSFAVRPRLPLRVALAIGSYEECFDRNAQDQCRDLLTPVHELRHVLNEHHYPYHYQEKHQGHSWGLWRDTLADALVYLLEESEHQENQQNQQGQQEQQGL